MTQQNKKSKSTSQETKKSPLDKIARTELRKETISNKDKMKNDILVAMEIREKFEHI